MTDIVYNKNGIPFDIDAIATDLNGKADVDLTNLSSTASRNFDGQVIASTLSLLSSASIPANTSGAGTVYTFDLSSYLPNDNYNYEVLVSFEINNGGWSSVYAYPFAGISSIAFAKDNSGANGGCILLPIGANRVLKLSVVSTTGGTAWSSVKYYRRIGTNS